MSKRYYYTDAIVALYMMKEFGVKFECKDTNGDVYDFQEWYLNSNNISELSLELENFPISIYVAKESEHIFEPKQGDLGHYDLNGGSGVYQFTNKPIRWAEGVTNIQIIRRDNKQFFMPEVEND
jgi:hypothetical protein